MKAIKTSGILLSQRQPHAVDARQRISRLLWYCGRSAMRKVPILHDFGHIITRRLRKRIGFDARLHR